MSELIQQHISQIIAGLTLLLLLSANLIAEKARRSAKCTEERGIIISKAEKRTEALIEIELKNAAVGNMMLVMARKVLLFHQHHDLDKLYPGEYDRLTKNLDLMQDLHAKNNYQQQVAETALEGDSIASHEKALADVRRLRVSLENEIRKETYMLEDILQELRDARV